MIVSNNYRLLRYDRIQKPKEYRPQCIYTLSLDVCACVLTFENSNSKFEFESSNDREYSALKLTSELLLSKENFKLYKSLRVTFHWASTGGLHFQLQNVLHEDDDDDVR